MNEEMNNVAQFSYECGKVVGYSEGWRGALNRGFGLGILEGIGLSVLWTTIAPIVKPAAKNLWEAVKCKFAKNTED